MSTQPRCTHASNAVAHPGAIILASQGKRQTKAQKKADDNHAAERQAAIEKAEQERVTTIAKMVLELQEGQPFKNTLSPEVLEQASPSGANGTYSSESPTNSTLANTAVEQGSKDQTLSNAHIATTRTKPKKTPKALLKVKINEVSKTITDSTGNAAKASCGLDEEPNLSQYSLKMSLLLLNESTLWFINLLVSDYESIRKKSLSGVVKGWATNVHEKTLSKSSMNTPNPSASGTPSSQSTRLATPSLIIGTTTGSSTQYSTASDTGITTKFGSFDLNSDAEEETAPFKNRE
ncbi:hypothetical protein J3R83DRAFT_11882 [Lanmaoa asiatica]|nr:hypothetical protein J3R83DRAFT_11882 [Lanmaoa asiatica]